MSDKYKIREIDKAYFVTPTVFGWIAVFTRASCEFAFEVNLRNIKTLTNL